MFRGGGSRIDKQTPNRLRGVLTGGPLSSCGAMPPVAAQALTLLEDRECIVRGVSVSLGVFLELLLPFSQADAPAVPAERAISSP